MKKTQKPTLPLHLERPLVVFDIESTGTNRQTDRIIDIAFLKIYPTGETERHVFRVNPGISIPPEATAVHGITNEDVKDKPAFSAIAPKVLEIMEGCDLAGYNVNSFDIPLLEAEFQRANIQVDLRSRNIVDAQRIYHKKVPRDLPAALHYYCGEMHLDAHSAMADVEATWRVLLAQIERYDDLPRDVPGLSQYCCPRDPTWLDRNGKFRWSNGKVILSFGIYQGRCIEDVVQEDPDYLRHLIEKAFVPQDCYPIIEKALARQPLTPPKK